MGRKVNRVSDFGQAWQFDSPAVDIARASRLFELRDIGGSPNDFGAVVTVKLLHALARITCDLSKRINGVREHTRENCIP